eukprot:CAMPEP_0201509014 /NCGR_PEP_ID=MMETSP0161_2-20130828/2192_1 /ASSEMBLY_ACC=CAM_ASM_000251 /TAXON_ID=180227 /ORGANISM="Neoparamoeba aestuarina, Strain SoJaBio B1-5/56/2" /LENGTH=46 /DNA_ID= /DNA_START= /DNA_END= /DNA_ORIENTATION=
MGEKEKEGVPVGEKKGGERERQEKKEKTDKMQKKKAGSLSPPFFSP